MLLSSPITRHARHLATATCVAVFGWMSVGTSPVQARDNVPSSGPVNKLPSEFDGVDIQNKLGVPIDQNLRFTADDGREVRLSSFFDGTRPVLLTLNYYRCASVCSVQLNELVSAMAELSWVPGGEEFRIVTISFDPRDSTEVAHGKRESYARALISARANAEDETMSVEEINVAASKIQWDFLTGEPAMIKALTKQMGYFYRYDEDSAQYAHSPVVYIISPKGKISRYLWGTTYQTHDIKFALMDAADGHIGTLFDKALASCFVFDADDGGYKAFAWGFMRIGATLVAVVLGLWLLLLFYRERRRRGKDSGRNDGPGLPPNTSLAPKGTR
jgi:protein SCO1/2